MAKRDLSRHEVSHEADYEFLNHSVNGLDLISQYEISHNSILVTSHADETLIQERCEQLSVQLIPKSLAEYVKIL